MPTTLQFRRYDTANIANLTGAVGEIFIDTDKDTIVVQDGSTAGGFALAREGAYTQANNARDQANSARDQANTAYGQANAAYGAANTKLNSAGGTISGDLIISGNLEVLGNSTTLNVETLVVEDNEITLNGNVSGAPTLNAFITINRGSSLNANIVWRESVDQWQWNDGDGNYFAFDSALDAYAQANTARGTANDAYGQANTARDTANSAYGQANTARGTANDAYAQANTARDTANGAYGQANGAYSQANGAYAHANIVYSQANNSYDQANAAYGQANTARGTANDSYGQANTARNTANDAYAGANTANTNALNAYAQANSARDQANSAYGDANTRVLKAGDTMTGTLNVQSHISANVFRSTNTTLSAPSTSTFDGERLRLYDFNQAGHPNYAIGVEGSHIWHGVDDIGPTLGFKWYGNTTLVGLLRTNSTFEVSNTVSAKVLKASGTGTAVDASQGNILTNKVTGTEFAFLNGLYTTTVRANIAQSADYTFRLPSSGGTNGFVLTTDGNGDTIWSNAIYSLANTTYDQANSARDQANTARSTANDAYAGANTANTNALNAYGQANTARDTANDSYSQANTARNTANDAYAGANTANTNALNSYAQANTARDQANTARDTANGAYAQANGAYAQANIAYAHANIVYAQANTARDTANDAYGQANSARDQANTARGQANGAYAQANAAYGEANLKLNLTGGTLSGDLTVAGNLTVTGSNTLINVSNLSVNDSIILLSANAVGDAYDIGFVGHFDRGATNTHAGLIRKASLNEFYLFDNYEVEPTNNIIDINGQNFRLGNVRLNTINANSVLILGNEAATQANLTLAHNQANSARDQANTARDTANAAYGAANTAGTNALNAYGQANSARDQANTARGTANDAYGAANTAQTTAQNAYGQANTARDTANNAYGAANNRVLKAGDTMTGQLNISSGGLLVTGTANVDNLFVRSPGGDEGGEIKLANAITNQTLAGVVSIDVYQNKIRFFENGGTSRGFYIDLTTGGAGAGTDLAAGSGTADAYNQANTARDTANAAYGQANTARNTANDAYGGANTANTNALNAYGQANTARNTANSAYGQANTATTNAGNAYDQANTARDQANTARNTSNSAYGQANTATTNAGNSYDQANTARDQANTARNTANSAYGQANTATTNAGNAYDQANTARNTANSAYGAANNAVLATGGTATTLTLKSYREGINTRTITGSTVTADLSGNNIFDYTLQAATVAITFSNAPASGNAFPITLILRQPGTAANLVTFANTVNWSSAEAPVLASGIASRLDIISIITVDGGTVFFGAHSMANVAY